MFWKCYLKTHEAGSDGTHLPFQLLRRLKQEDDGKFKASLGTSDILSK